MEIAVCTLSSDSYIKGTQTLLYSFIKNNKWFCGDFVVMSSDTLCPLSQHNRDLLLGIYSNVKFVEIDERRYKKLFSIWSTQLDRIKLSSVMKFNAFLLTSYDKVLYLDSDCVVDSDIEDMFSKFNGFGACVNDYASHKNFELKMKKNIVINTGVFAFDKQFIGQFWFDSLIREGLSINNIGVSKSLDCEILNSKLFNRSVIILPSIFNILKRTNATEGKIYHFNNKKPWISTVGFESMCEIWTKYFNESKSSKTVREKKCYVKPIVEKPVERTKKKIIINRPVTNNVVDFNMKSFEDEYQEFIKKLTEIDKNESVDVVIENKKELTFEEEYQQFIEQLKKENNI